MVDIRQSIPYSYVLLIFLLYNRQESDSCFCRFKELDLTLSRHSEERS